VAELLVVVAVLWALTGLATFDWLRRTARRDDAGQWWDQL